MMVYQVRLEYLKQFNLDLMPVSGKVKMNQRHAIQVFWQPPKELQDIEQEVFPRSKPQQKNYRKRNKVTETKIYSPWKDAILKGNSSSTLDFQVQTVSLRELRIFSTKIQSWFWITEIDPIWISHNFIQPAKGGILWPSQHLRRFQQRCFYQKLKPRSPSHSCGGCCGFQPDAGGWWGWW